MLGKTLYRIVVGTQVDGGEVFWVQYKTILFFGIGFWQYVTKDQLPSARSSTIQTWTIYSSAYNFCIGELGKIDASNNKKIVKLTYTNVIR
jgi:hypothetical protein